MEPLCYRPHSESNNRLMEHHGDMMASFTSTNGGHSYGAYGGDRGAPPPEIPPRSPARAGYPLSPNSVPAPILPPDNGAVTGTCLSTQCLWLPNAQCIREGGGVLALSSSSIYM